MRPNVNRIFGFKVGPGGEMYIFGEDPVGAVDAAPNQGRILKVPSNLSGASVLANNIGAMAEADIKDGHLRSATASTTGGAISTVRVDVNSGAVTAASTPRFGLLPYLANALDESGNLVWFSGGGGTSQNLFDFYLNKENYTGTPYDLYAYPLTAAPAEWHRPYAMSWDTTTNRAVWACEYGIVAAGATDTDLPQTIVRVGTGIAYGMEQVTSAGGSYLYTGWGFLPTTNPDWQSVWYADAGGTPTVALRLNNAAPCRIERDNQGNWYVMATEGWPGNIGYRAASTSGRPNVRIIKCRFDSATKKLIPERTLIDTFNDKTAVTY